MVSVLLKSGAFIATYEIILPVGRDGMPQAAGRTRHATYKLEHLVRSCYVQATLSYFANEWNPVFVAAPVRPQGLVAFRWRKPKGLPLGLVYDKNPQSAFFAAAVCLVMAAGWTLTHETV